MEREIVNLPVTIAEQLKKEAAEIAKRITVTTSDRIRYNANRGFITPDGEEGEELEVVIVDFVSSNMFYDSPFNKDNPAPPACFAIGPEPTTLVPSPNSPNKQSEACAVCPNNQFGSALSGKGKACKNTRFLAVIPLTEEAPLWTLSVPPDSIKNFDAYVKMLAAKLRITPIGVVTRISLDPDKQYAAPRFTVVRPLTPEEIEQFMERREEARARLTVEPDVSQYVPPKNPRRR